MVGLTEQLQADALNPNYPVSDLLRKVKVVAVKLGLPGVEDWVSSELNGYAGPVPAYRQLMGVPKALEPRSGRWIPILLPADFMDTIWTMPLPASLATIEDLLTGSSPFFVIAYPPQAVDAMCDLTRAQVATMGLHVPRNAYAALMDKVRTLVLDWALELEKRGIMGEGLSFNDQERRRAAAAPVMIGSVSGPNARINIGSVDQSSNTST
jgi:hypothetical protein